MCKFVNIVVILAALIIAYPAAPVGAADFRPIKIGLATDQDQISLNVADAEAFLDLSGNDPSPAFVAALIDSCGKSGPIFVYNAGFESGRIKELAERFPKRRQELLKLVDRIVDLLPIARDHYYHPSQQGSWSIKAVLPALCSELSYAQLDGVQDGGMAMDAYAEAIHPNITPERKTELELQLWKYCELDTWAMVKLWEAFIAN